MMNVILFILFCLCGITCALNKTDVEYDEESDEEFEDTKCWADMQSLFAGLNTSELWALQMMDASSKLQAGLLAGNLVDFGHWDECLTVDSGTFHGQHCVVFVEPQVLVGNSSILPKELHFRAGFQKHIEIGLSYCVPSSCRGTAIKKAIEDLLMKIDTNVFPEDFPLRADDHFCNTNEKEPFSTIEYVAIGVFSFFGFILIISTCCEGYRRYREQKPHNTLWLAFSMLSNGENILTISQTSKIKSDDIISCIHGLRALSMLWIIFGHEYLVYKDQPGLLNPIDYFHYSKTYWNMILTSGPLSADTFLIISGFLLTYQTLKRMFKADGRLPLHVYYIRRYLRLTPALAAIVLLHCSFLYRFSFGPFWKSEIFRKRLRDDCQTYWWAPFLYIQNYYNPDNMCVSNSWYLSVDMQLYIIAPMLLIPLFKLPKPTLVFIGALSLAAIVINFAIVYINNFTGIMTDISFHANPNIQGRMLYLPSHTRFAPWLFGMVLGYVMNKTRHSEIRINKVICLLTWAIALAMIPAVFLGGRSFYRIDLEHDVMLSSFYQALHRQAWSLLICWLIFACHNGYGGPINWFLSLGIWQPISRLSYCMFLLHMQIQLAKIAAGRTSVYFSELDLIREFLSDIGICVIISFFWSLAFEAPFGVLQKVIIDGQSRETTTSEKFPPKKILRNEDTEQGSLEESKAEINKGNELFGHIDEVYNEKL